jgi:hypothetical protein
MGVNNGRWLQRLVLMGVGSSCLLWASCGLFKGSSGGGPSEEPPSEEEVAKAPTQLVGEVASVHEAEGFVLIKRFGGGALPEGFVFHTQSSSGESASLRPTGERLGRFYAADITAGTANAGDFVVARRLPEAAPAPSTPATQPKKPGAQFP